jgi:hypothetical protein
MTLIMLAPLPLTIENVFGLDTGDIKGWTDQDGWAGGRSSVECERMN